MHQHDHPFGCDPWQPTLPGGTTTRAFFSSLIYTFAALILATCLLPCTLGARAQSAPTTSAVRSLASLTWDTDSVEPSRFAAVHGRRALIEGYSESGLEIWAYPVQIVDGYHPGFLVEGASTEIDGRTLLRRITYTPQAITRIYIGPDFVIEERLFVPLQLPGALITYTVHSRRPVDILVHFHPVLNLMWPAAAGGQSLRWDATAIAYRLTEPLNRFSAVVGSKEAVAHDPIFNSAQPLYGSGETFAIRPRETGQAKEWQGTVFLAGNDGAVDPVAVADSMLRDRAPLEAEAATHYAQLLHTSLSIETPDARLNRDLAWATIALDQAWVTNPQLGSGQAGGYGASRSGRRPQYAWFFANDALVAIPALMAEGEFSRARDVLAFLIRYQDPKTGMMWHELSQSAGYLDWVGKYPYMFVHVDITFDYLIGLDNYLLHTGDTAFLTEHWPSIEAAYRYCRSVVSGQDGLPHVPAGKEAANEQDRLSEELTLSASWVGAAQAYAHLSAATGHNSEVAAAQQASDRARRAVATRYWNNSTGFWIDGFTDSGAPVNSRSSAAAGVLGQNIFTPQQTATVLDALASPVFQTDWGSRSYASNSSAYDPDAYAKGSVWATGTARIAQLFWEQHMPYPAWQTWSALPAWSSIDSLGHTPEVLSGDFYHEEDESVPEQTWSSAGFLSSTIEGLLGIEFRVQEQQRDQQQLIQFAPHLPGQWDHVAIDHLRVGASTLALHLTRTDGSLMLDAENSGPAVRLLFDPSIAAGATLSQAQWNGKAVPVKLVGRSPAGPSCDSSSGDGSNADGSSEETLAHFDLAIPAGKSHLNVRMEGGIAILLEPPRPLLGATSRESRILHAVLSSNGEARTYTITAAVPIGEDADLMLRTPWKIQDVQGASLSPSSGTTTDTYTLHPAHNPTGADSATSQAGSAGYRTQVVVVHLMTQTSSRR